MQTEHEVVVGDARSLSTVDDGSVDLVVTSPPYPMIEMWDETFEALDPAVGEALGAGDGERAFSLMHAQLDAVWDEVERVLVPGGVACLNVGDATRSIGGSFRLFPNHARVVDALTDRGFQALPDILWRKPSNRATKFMGSGMLPPNAYVSLEHEYVLVFRKGDQRRSFEPGSTRRYESAYFWEERNRWFSDVWRDVRGVGQTLPHEDLRDRSGAYPLTVPYRLVNMYSVRGDTVLDPFWGTGSTTVAAMLAGRDSVGYELASEFADAFRERVEGVPSLSRQVNRERLDAHREFVAEGERSPGYEATHYDFPVVTRQERDILFHSVESVAETQRGYVAEHAPFETVEPTAD